MSRKIIRSVNNAIKKSKYGNLIRRNVAYPENRFVIYTRGRTGSTLLTELINCHPDIFCDVEIFNYLYCKSRVMFPNKYIKSCSRRASLLNKPVYGFKVKIAQLRFEHKYKNYDSILKQLSEDGWKFIYLKRTNFLRHKLSNLLAAETQVFHLKKNDAAKFEKIKVNCDVLLEGIRYSEEVERTESDNLKNIPHITVEYEKDLLRDENHQKISDKIFSYLGLESCSVSTDYKRLTGDNLEDVIANYDEVVRFFKNTEYEKYLN